MVEKTIKHRNTGSLQMDCVVRVQNIPIVENGIKKAEDIYNRIKCSNALLNWYFSTIENVSVNALETIKPLVYLAENPIQKVDQTICKGLDIVEQRVPGVYLPPEMLFWNTKEYVSNTFVKPVIERATSMKNISNAVLVNNADRALTAADSVIEKYLPDNSQDEKDGASPNAESGAIVHVIQHGRQVSRKLKRRLTKRTIEEVTALKKQGREAVNVLVYAAELIITDPKQAVQQTKELWQLLSLPEPENQARPETLEQLVVLVVREAARRVVHLSNFAVNGFCTIPRQLQQSCNELVHHLIIASDSFIKAFHLQQIRNRAGKEIDNLLTHVQVSYEEIQIFRNRALEQLAIFLSGRLEAEKISPNPRRRAIRRQANANNNPAQQAEVNGSY